MPKAIISLPIPVPSEVSAFAAEQGLSAELQMVVDMTRRIFPDAAISVELDIDPEIASDRHIAVLASGVNLTVDQGMEASRSWHRELFHCCPATSAWVFRLGLELAS
jgi:hypothetical protein